MNIKELRIGNLIIYEACTFELKAISIKQQPGLEGGSHILLVKSCNHPEWKPDKCGINEVQGIDITTDFLKKNGFEILNKAMPELWIKPLGGYRYIRYHSGVRYMDFEDTHTFQRVPWAIRYVHQMQNACIDYGIDLEFKA
jgi:hypothetical protein